MPLPPLVEPVPALSGREAARTARHAALAGFGALAQRRLAAAHVAIVGAGGLGSPVVLALAAAGVGTLTVVDDDAVELANLQRQVMHRVGDVGTAKVDSAVRVAADLSPETAVRAVRVRLDRSNAADVLRGADVVLDGTDTFASRRVVADACERLGIPLVWGVVQEFHAQVTVFWSHPPVGAEAVVLDDLHPDADEAPSCAETGVLGALTLQVGAIMATEAIKLIVGVGDPLLGRVLVVDALAARTHEVPLRSAASPSRREGAGSSREGASSVDDGAPPARAASTPAHTTGTPASTTSTLAQEGALVTAEQMLAAQAAGATLLDVREPHETARGVVAGSVVVPLGELLADPDAAGPGPFVVICAHGIRAERAAQVLRARGTRADVLVGGLAEWTTA